MIELIHLAELALALGAYAVFRMNERQWNERLTGRK